MDKNDIVDYRESMLISALKLCRECKENVQIEITIMVLKEEEHQKFVITEKGIQGFDIIPLK